MAEWKERCEWQNGCGTMEGETGRGTSRVVIKTMCSVTHRNDCGGRGGPLGPGVTSLVLGHGGVCGVLVGAGVVLILQLIQSYLKVWAPPN